MVVIFFKIDNNDNNSNGEDVRVTFEYSDTSKTIREMLIEFVKKNNSFLKLASKDREQVVKTLSNELLMFMFKAKILNSESYLKMKVDKLFRTDNNIVRIIDTGNILGGIQK